MKRLKNILLGTLAVMALTACSTSGTGEVPGEKTEVNAAVLKGPTAIGMVEIMENNENDEAFNTYNFEILGAADEIPAKIIKGEIDIAAVPCNLASVLYNRTEGGVKVLAVNTLGVLYVLDTTGEIESIDDLQGKTIYSTGKGTTPEFSLNYILEKNNMVPGEDVFIEFKSESAEIAAAFASGEAEIAVLPEPYVSTVTSANEDIQVVLSLTEEWNKVEEDFNLITGVVIVREEFLSENEAAVKNFMTEYKASIDFVNNNVDEAGKLTAKFEIVPNEQAAVKAIPNCNIVYIDGENMQADISGYLSVLYDSDPSSVGGEMPDEDFYYIP